jgi:hypothetical protein
MKSRIRKILRNEYGSLDTYLEEVYETKIVDILSQNNKKLASEWLTYNQVILELRHNLKDTLHVMELQYRLTDAENPTRACLDVLSNMNQLSPELERLYGKILNL